MAFKLFKNDDEHFEDAVDLIKRKEYEKAMGALRKAKSKDKDGSLSAKCDAMEAFINLYNKQDDPGAYINAANKLKAYTGGPLEMGLSTFDPQKLAEECLLMSRTLNARNMPTDNPDASRAKGDRLTECARDFQTIIGNGNLTIREFFGGGVTVGMKESIALMAEANEAYAEAYAWDDPKKAAEYQQFAYNYRKQIGESGEKNLELIKKYAASATCWICGRDANGEGIHFYAMSSDISPCLRKDDGVLRSADEKFENIYVCRACYSSISRRADAISKYYYDVAQDDMRKMEARLQAEIASLQAEITSLRFQGFNHG
jgi:hypothetical protein